MALTMQNGATNEIRQHADSEKHGIQNQDGDLRETVPQKVFVWPGFSMR
jgi:hypothetical protein